MHPRFHLPSDFKPVFYISSRSLYAESKKLFVATKGWCFFILWCYSNIVAPDIPHNVVETMRKLGDALRTAMVIEPEGLYASLTY